MYNLDSWRDARRIILGSAEREGNVSFLCFGQPCVISGDSSDFERSEMREQKWF